MVNAAPNVMDNPTDGGSVYSFGLALSGGSFRGLAHIGVVRALERYGLAPDFIAGTSAGSLIGALCAAGRSADEIEAIALQIFWPGLLRSQGIHGFCRKYLPATFEQLGLPLHVAATELPSRKTHVFSSGDLASALAASCATPPYFHRVHIHGVSYTDGGSVSVLPSSICRANSCRIVIGSDVWLRSAMAAMSGVSPDSKHARTLYSRQYVEAFR
ncbi:MAG TPA: patatin-like phospholipase family protein, partial [Candidatus Angelobacter sp.]|nr:patatin-like phospholipase family protein [Candidatus Angelobacter sp.]